MSSWRSERSEEECQSSIKRAKTYAHLNNIYYHLELKKQLLTLLLKKKTKTHNFVCNRN